MEALKLKVEPRQVTGKKVSSLRRQGIVPAVVYGQGLEAKLLQIESKQLQKVLRQAGSHNLILLEIEGQESQIALAREVQREPIKHQYVHVDFYAVSMDVKVTARVPIITTGVSPAVRDLGGILMQGLDELEIECLPADLISSITVNIDSLANFHDSLTVADIKLPDTITILSGSDSMVVRVEAPRAVVAEEESAALPTSAEPEVIKVAKEKDKEKE